MGCRITFSGHERQSSSPSRGTESALTARHHKVGSLDVRTMRDPGGVQAAAGPFRSS